METINLCQDEKMISRPRKMWDAGSCDVSNQKGTSHGKPYFHAAHTFRIFRLSAAGQPVCIVTLSKKAQGPLLSSTRANFASFRTLTSCCSSANESGRCSYIVRLVRSNRICIASTSYTLNRPSRRPVCFEPPQWLRNTATVQDGLPKLRINSRQILALR